MASPHIPDYVVLLSVLLVGVTSNVLLKILQLGWLFYFLSAPVISGGPTTLGSILSFFFKGGREINLVTIEKVFPDVSALT